MTIDGQVVGGDGHGILLHYGICPQDGEKEAAWLADKVWSTCGSLPTTGLDEPLPHGMGGRCWWSPSSPLYGTAKRAAPSYTDAAHSEIADPAVSVFRPLSSRTLE